VTGPGIRAGLANKPAIARLIVLPTVERLAALGWPRRELAAGAAVMPVGNKLHPGHDPGHEVDEQA